MVEGLADAIILSTRRRRYMQVRADQAPLPGTLNTAKPDFIRQMVYQHAEAYVALLGLSSYVDLTTVFPELRLL
jgi:hypothetical protein